MTDFILKAVAALLFAVVMRQAALGPGSPPEQMEDGTVVLRPGLIFKLVGWGSLAFAGGVIILAMKVGARTPGDRLSFVLAVALMGATGWYLLTVARNKRIEISGKGIVEFTTWGDLRHIRWHDVKAVTFSPGMQHILVVGPETPVRIDVGTTGISHFWRAVEGNLKPELWTRGRLDFNANMRRKGADPGELT